MVNPPAPASAHTPHRSPAASKAASKPKSSPAAAASTPAAARTPSSAKGKKRRESKGTPSQQQPSSSLADGAALPTPNGSGSSKLAAVPVTDDASSADGPAEWEFEIVAGSAVPKQAPVFTSNAS